MEKNIVGVRYKNKRTGGYDGRVYSYFCDLPVVVGDIVSVPTSQGDTVAQVFEINVPASQIAESILPKLKTITSFAQEEQEAQEEAKEVDSPPVTRDLIIVKQLPIIEERLRVISEQIKSRTQEALALVCTEDTVKEIKRVRAELSSGFKELEAQRKAVKSKVLSPYEQFEAIYKACVTDIYAPADAQLKSRIDEVENTIKDEKRQEIAAFFDEYAKAKGIDFLEFAQAGIQVTLSASTKSLKATAAQFIERVSEDLGLIATQKHQEEIIVEYKRSLNVASAITSVSRRHEAIEAERRRMEEARNAREQREAAAQKVTEAVTEDVILAPPVVGDKDSDLPPAPEVASVEKIYSATFTVRGTKEQLKALKAFLVDGRYEYASC